MKPLTVSDKYLVESFLKRTSYEGYNYNFNSMMMWNHAYSIQYDVCEQYMILQYRYKNLIFWLMPLCLPEYYEQAIVKMQQISRQEGIPFVLSYVEEPFKQWMEEKYGTCFTYTSSPDYSEYVYSCERNRTLSGRKMVKRRNHFNAFLREHPDYVYKNLESEDLNEVRNCLIRWEQEKQTKENTEMLRSEYKGIMELLKNFSRLDYQGGCIYLNGQMEAFIIGSALGKDSVEIHAEKANSQIRGLYVAILKEFLSHHFPDTFWMNREEDLGYENLRKAKRQLHPVRMVENYTCREMCCKKESRKEHAHEKHNTCAAAS